VQLPHLRKVIMFEKPACRRLRVGLLLVSSLAIFAGCNRGPEIAQVSGKVLFKDGTVPRGGVCAVRFEPSSDTPAQFRQGAGGSIEADGSFEMCRRKPGDGVFLGKYAVTFTVWKAPREPLSLIDEKYTNSVTTPYHVTIDDDVDNLFFEIEPAGRAGVAPTASQQTN
jgi:hypothetical protein